MNGAECFLGTLESAGVRFLFGTPGTTETELLAKLDGFPEIEYLLVLHESVAVAMADGYARASGKPGVVNVHTTVGTANTLGMAINAYADYSPVVITAGIRDSRCLGGGVFCDSPLAVADLLRQYTLSSWQCLEPGNIYRDTLGAFESALRPPQGPVFLAIPENFWTSDVENVDRIILGTLNTQGAASDEDVKEATRLITSAQRPVILAGNEVGKYNCGSLLVELAEALHAPVFSEERMSWAFLNFPNNHKLYCGCYDPQYELIRDADLLIGVGSKMFMPFGYSTERKVDPQTKIVHLHSDISRIGGEYPANVPLAGGVKNNLSLVLGGLETDELPTIDRGWEKLLLEHKERRMQEMAEREKIQPEGERVGASQLAAQLSELAAPDAVLVNEGIRSGFYFQDHFELPLSRSYFGYTGGCLGWGVPAAMGAKLAYPERQVIAVVGDGSFVFTNQALWTSARYGIGIKIVVCNNGGYMAVRSSLREHAGDDACLVSGPQIGEFCQPAIDFVSLARSFGVAAQRVEVAGMLQPILEETLNTPGPALVEVWVDSTGLTSRPV